MAQVFVPGLEVSEQRVVRRTRELPIAGTINVKVGDRVDATQIVAQAELPGPLQILRIAEKTGLEPFEVLKSFKARSVKIGDDIHVGQKLCEHTGLFGLLKTEFLSPCSGTIEFISETNGHLGVRQEFDLLTVNAFISGNVVEVIPQRSVTIESSAALLQGIFGVGGERQGQLLKLDIDPQSSLRPEHIPNDCKGKILFGGSAPSIAVLEKASNSGAVGLITGSIDDVALKNYLGYDIGVALTGDEDLPMTVIITEGFGQIGMSTRVLGVLSRFDGMQASINGATQVRAGAIRPEIIICHDLKLDSSPENNLKSGLCIGSRIRAIRHPYFGRRGEVLGLPHDPAVLESGAITRVLRAKLDDGAEVIIPRANVELV